uniref:Thioredoxin-like protein 1 n=1 Tax=Ditylenchus dipsaci TaxID=166011 RepID=A0A915EKR0_9BILA
MPLAQPQTDAEFNTILANAGTTPVIVDFFATWCGPCNNIAPIFKQISDLYPNLKFTKVDVDKCKETQAKNNITALPTFAAFLNGQKMDALRGASKDALEGFVRKWSENVPSQLDSPVPGQLDLLGFIDRAQCECLNEEDRNNFQVLLDGVGRLVSDCDEQLIINIQFNQPVKVHSLLIQGAAGAGPKKVKVFANTPTTLDFDKAQSSQGIQTLDFGDEPLQGLYYVKFQNVQSIQLFVEDNQAGSDKTIIEKLKLYGTPLQATNMQDFKRIAGKAGEASH